MISCRSSSQRHVRRRDCGAIADPNRAPSDSPYPPECAVLAPLAGYTDEPFRRMCRECGCRYAFTPLVDAQAVVHGKERNRTLLARGHLEEWLGVQLLGSHPDVLRAAALRLNDEDMDLLDFNLGCPVPKVRRRGAGAALGEQPSLAARCLESLARSSRFPVTAKIRVLSDRDPEATLRLARLLVDSGACTITIHGRMVDRLYAGPVALDVIRAVAAELPIPVVANGGVFCRADAALLRRETGCSRIMVARGAIGNPWLFRELSDPSLPPPTHEEVCSCLESQVRGMMGLHGEAVGLRQARKIVAAYLKGRGYPRRLRVRAMKLAAAADLAGFLCELRTSRSDDVPCPTSPSGDRLGAAQEGAGFARRNFGQPDNAEYTAAAPTIRGGKATQEMA